MQGTYITRTDFSITEGELNVECKTSVLGQVYRTQRVFPKDLTKIIIEEDLATEEIAWVTSEHFNYLLKKILK